MKFKSDFITNSSSSSFLIAMIDSPKVDDETLARYPFIAKYMEMVSTIFLSGSIIKDTKSLNQHFLDEYAWGTITTVEELFVEDDWMYEMYQKCKKMLEKDYLIFEKTIDRSEESISDILYSLEDGESFIILQGGE